MSTAEHPDDEPCAIELRGITKRFPGVVANHDINLRVRRGEVHAVVGENGAGKSTLMRTLYGMHAPDEGEILVDGTPHRFTNPTAAIAAGIGMVHQHFMLAENFTALENVMLGSEPRRGRWFDPRLDTATAQRRLMEVSDRYGLQIRPNRLVGDLSVAQRQRVEIAKVLFRGARVLILDEPTAVLVPEEVDELFGNLAELRREGLSVIFISHKLDEVLKVADAITVIRRGTTVGTVTPAETSPRALAQLMVGSELPQPDTGASTVTDQVELELSGVSVAADTGPAALAGVDLVVRRGEVAGFAGVEGNGQSELIEVIAGLRRPSTGTVSLGGEDITRWSARRRREAGMALIPEDRHRQALLLQAPLWETRLLGHETRPAFSVRGWIRRRAVRADTRRIMREYDVRAPDIDTFAGALSGGNQQKLVIGREMSGTPRVLLAAHPTRGVDVGAQASIWAGLREARRAGLATVLVSADLEELIGLSDTLYVLLRGRVIAKLDPAEVTPEVLGAYMSGAATGAEGAA